TENVSPCIGTDQSVTGINLSRPRMPTEFPRVRITDCPHQAIHEDMVGQLILEHEDHTATIDLLTDNCRANSWIPVKPSKSRNTATSKVARKPKTVQPRLEIQQVESDCYTLNYAGRVDSSLNATNISIQELEMALNAVQLFQASQ